MVCVDVFALYTVRKMIKLFLLKDFFVWKCQPIFLSTERKNEDFYVSFYFSQSQDSVFMMSVISWISFIFYLDLEKAPNRQFRGPRDTKNQ